MEQLHTLIKSYSPDHLNYIVTDPGLNYEMIQRHLRMGKWNCLHFNATSKLSSTDVLRLVPWNKSDAWYVGSTTSYFETTNEHLSMLIYLQEFPISMIIEKKFRFESYRNNWNTVLDAMLPIYELFGGKDELKNLEKYVHDDSLWIEPKIDDQELFRRRKKLSLSLNDSESNHFLWNFIEEMQNDLFIPKLPAIELDMHEERILSAISARAYLNGFTHDFDELEELFMQATLFAHGFGAEGSDMWINPRASETSSEVFAPLDLMLDQDEENSEKIKNMPEYHIAKAMNEQKELYNGVAHIEVAALMDDQYNEPKKAWKYLEAAGYWAGKNLPFAQETILDAAIHLCNKHSWEEAEEVLYYNKRLMNT